MERKVKRATAAGREELAMTALRQAAIGERIVATAHLTMLEARTAEVFWGAVQGLAGAMGLPGVCLMLDGRLFECGKRGGGEAVLAAQMPRGRLLLRMEPESRRAAMALVWVVRRALEAGAGEAKQEGA